MTPIALVLNLLLGALLVAALALGVRLDRRLKALRQSQQSFIKAVADLDQAAARTHAGLQQWRDATDEAREMLHDRIEKAKLQTAKLDALLSRPIPEAPLAPTPSAAPSARMAELARKFERPQPEPEVQDAEARAEIFAAMLAGKVDPARRPPPSQPSFAARRPAAGSARPPLDLPRSAER
jgi:hypothetical protein